MMKLLDKREFNLNSPPALLMAKMDVLTVADHRLFKMLKSVSDSDVPELLGILNRINNQGITSMDLHTYSYTIDSVIELGFADLATSELLFLYAYAAMKSNTIIYFSNYLYQLTQRTCSLFFSIFENCDCINFLMDADDILYYSEFFAGGEYDKYRSGQ